MEKIFNIIMDALPVCIAYVDSEQRYQYNNRCYEKWFKKSAADCYGRKILDVVGPDAYRTAKKNIEKALRGHKVTFSSVFYTSYGLPMENEVTFLPDIDAAGKCVGFVVFAEDVAEKQQAIRSLEASRIQYRQLFDEIPAGMVLFEVLEDDDGKRHGFRYLKLNKSWQQNTGIAPEEVLGKTMAEVFPHMESVWHDAMNRVYNSGKSERIEEYSREFSSYFTISFFKPQVGLLAASCVDITEQKNAEQKANRSYNNLQQSFDKTSKSLLANKRRLNREVHNREGREKQLLFSDSVFTHTSEGICITNADGIIEQVNPAFSRITGYSIKDAVGENPRILKSEHHDVSFYEEMWKALLTKGSWEGEIWNRRKNGEVYLEYLSITAITDKKKNVQNYVAVFRDISELHHSREQIAYHSSYDILTSLPNRTLFGDHCNKLISYAEYHDETFGVAFLDLDKFKEVNESMGFECGDRILIEVAVRLQNCCRSQDSIARMGGDEFAILLPNSAKSIDNLLLIMTRVMQSLAEPFSIDNKALFLKTSIGLAVFPEHGQDSQSLLQKAEVALYEAKKMGGSRVSIFTRRVHEQIQRRVELKHDLRQALEQDEFELYYQPKVDFITAEIRGVEALIRWKREDGSIVPPDEFIPLAEESELITDIGSWVIEEACRCLSAWHAKGWHEFTVAVNLSARQFVYPELLPLLLKTVKRYGLSPRHLQLEITEHTMVEQIDKTVTIMEKLSEHGFAISLDDFGTGFSSLSYLKQFPISTLKVDRTFVMNLPDDKHDSTIVNLTLSLAKSLGMDVVAEGVETEAQLEYLKALGCDEYQGYLCSKPLPAEELWNFVSNYKTE